MSVVPMPIGAGAATLTRDGHWGAMAERRPKPALVGDGEAIADDGAGKRRAAAREPQSLPSYLKETLSLVR